MGYQTYITEAIVCSAQSAKTSDRSFLLFTRDAGMIFASAKSVREERSKQRYALQECSHARVTLVRGKNGWKVTGAEPIADLYAKAATRDARAFLRNTIMLLRRVIHGESPHPDIFDDVRAACSIMNDADPAALETVLTLRVLHVLGYIAPEPLLLRLLPPEDLTTSVQSLTDEERRTCGKVVERALAESHL